MQGYAILTIVHIQKTVVQVSFGSTRQMIAKFFIPF